MWPFNKKKKKTECTTNFFDLSEDIKKISSNIFKDGICLCGAYTLPPFVKIDKSRPYSFKPNDSTPPPPPDSEFVHCFCCDRHFRVIIT